MILLILAVLGGWFLARSWRGLAGSPDRTLLEQTLNDSELPEDAKKEIQEQVQSIVAAFENGDLKEAQIETLMDEMAESPLSASVIAFTIEKKYFDRSGLSDEEKDTGHKTLHRCVRGWMDGDLTQEDADPVLSHIATKTDEGNWEFRDDVTDEELLGFLAEAKGRADAAGVPDTVEEVDPSDENKRLVDAALIPGSPAS